jgi:predicted alpha/beta hydrolase family esterase
MAYITLPGIGGSDESHWQTRWEQQHLQMKRFEPSSWEEPDRDDWLAALDRAIRATPDPPILVAHSLACLLVGYWAATSGVEAGRRVRGAFLVGVPDPQALAFPAAEAATFREIPDAPFPFPALVVASTDDPYGTVDHARRRATAWGAGLVVAGALGHINGASRLGDWPQGLALLEAFRAGTTRPSAQSTR